MVASLTELNIEAHLLERNKQDDSNIVWLAQWVAAAGIWGHTVGAQYQRCQSFLISHQTPLEKTPTQTVIF